MDFVVAQGGPDSTRFLEDPGDGGLLPSQRTGWPKEKERLSEGYNRRESAVTTGTGLSVNSTAVAERERDFSQASTPLDASATPSPSATARDVLHATDSDASSRAPSPALVEECGADPTWAGAEDDAGTALWKSWVGMQQEAPEGCKEVAVRGAVVVSALQRLARREDWDGEVAARHEVIQIQHVPG